MAYPTGIEWTDATWNPIGGCDLASPGCINCYAQELAGTRLAHLPLYAGTTDIVKGKHVFNGKLTVAPDDAPRVALAAELARRQGAEDGSAACRR